MPTKSKHPDDVRFEAEVKEMAAHELPGPGPNPHDGGKAKKPAVEE